MNVPLLSRERRAQGKIRREGIGNIVGKACEEIKILRPLFYGPNLVGQSLMCRDFTAISNCLFNSASGGADDPIGGRASDETVNVSRSNTERRSIVSSNQRSFSRQRGNDLGSRVAQGGRRRIRETIRQPSNSAIARNKTFALGTVQSRPLEPWEMTDLKIPRLHMKRLKPVLRAKNPFPSSLLVGTKIVEIAGFKPLSAVGVLDPMGSRTIFDFLKAHRRRFK